MEWHNAAVELTAVWISEEDLQSCTYITKETFGYPIAYQHGFTPLHLWLQETDLDHGIFQASLEFPLGLQELAKPMAVVSSIHAFLFPGSDSRFHSIDWFESDSTNSDQKLEVCVHM